MAGNLLGWFRLRVDHLTGGVGSVFFFLLHVSLDFFLRVGDFPQLLVHSVFEDPFKTCGAEFDCGDGDESELCGGGGGGYKGRWGTNRCQTIDMDGRR